MNTSFLGSSLGCRLRKARRSAATSGRSCSAACRLFFKGEFQMAQKSEDRALSDVDLLFGQLGSYLRQRHIRLLRHQAPDKFFIRRQTIGLVSTELRGADVARAALEPEEPNNRTQAHVMVIGSLRKRRALCNVIDHACAQIVRIWLRHSCWPPRPSAKLESDSVALVNPRTSNFPIQPFRKTL